MQAKTINRLYWIFVVLFAALMLLDGVAGVLRVAEGQVAMKQLGYPVYLMSILGVAKIAGALILLQPTFRTVKEWAYAGFACNFVGAAASWALLGKGIDFMLPALLMLGVLLVVYFLWKKAVPLPAADRLAAPARSGPLAAA